MEKTAHKADAGDVIVIAGHRVGEAERTAEILEVLGDVPNERFRVRWEDGHESVLRPGSDATIKRVARRRASSKSKR
jgi:ribosomal protein L4